MKILLVHKFLYPKGGAENYVLKLGALLEQQGHEVQYFGMESSRNTVGNQRGAYGPEMDFSAGLRKCPGAPLRIIYNRAAAKALRRVLQAFQPDAVHLNNIHYHLTPSVILAADRYRRRSQRPMAIVMTAHDYQLICPSHGLMDRHLKPCQRCINGNFLPCFLGRCVKNSYAKSLLAMIDAYVWKHSDAYERLDAILCPSRFLKDKLDTQARFREKTVVLPNFAALAPMEPVEKAEYVLQFGHLSRDKGTDTLLAAARRMPQTKFVFAGFGEAEARIKDHENCEYVGFLTGEALLRLISRAQVTVCPSLVPENCPYAVIESQLCGTPVVASRVGGIPELLKEGETGELFAPGNAAQLEEKLRKLLSEPDRMARYGQACRNAKFETAHSYMEKLMKIYGGAYDHL